ncbi:hypothetical protein [Paludisphaera mucosa]|uniref:Uncharacterized protein n=1 Tax=Paludisphaera mucosa TaxID=3030827 RepID=A0ABT6FDI3_9BACT|nr:hypothetical protein [Paludisphaera mucosa]MDG3005630.1 hypothetical protein [Paludisphaera mucosa]
MGRSPKLGNEEPRARGLWPLAAIWLVGLPTLYATARAQAPADGSQAGVEVLTRGPVHEAFAVPVVNDPRPGLVAPKTPPPAVEELPPDEKPAGDDVQWMAGYWSWDQSRADFVWISGIWREPPPGRQWVPGYWNPVANGCQWVPGAWIPVAQAGPATLDADVMPAQGEAVYLPEPPASLEVGPNIPQPAGEVFWSPGCWSWRQSRYVWRPGFWAAVQPTWVWVPAHYVWTPGGCLFVEGYWDLPLVERGILFAPVYYAQPVYLQPAYVYSPTITIAAPGLVANLFVQPSYNHYCFGDYYDRSFLSVGVFPWFSMTYVSGPRPPAYYDPLFTFYASVNVRSNPGWAARCREDYVLRRDNIAMRPPRTYIEQTRIVQTNVNITNNITINRQGPGGRPGHRPGPAAMIGRPIDQVAMRRSGPEPGGPRMERVGVDARRQWQTRSREMADFRLQRAGREVEAAPRPGPGGPRPGQPPQLAQARPRPFAMAASPVSAPRLDRPQVERPTGPMRRPEHQASPSVGTAARPAGPRHLAANDGVPPVAGSTRPQVRERPPGRVERPVARGAGPAFPGHQPDPAANRPGLSHLGKAEGAPARPNPAGPAAGRPFAPRHLGEGPATAQPPRAGAPRANPRRPPPTPHPAGPVPRAGRRNPEADGRPNP